MSAEDSQDHKLGMMMVEQEETRFRGIGVWYSCNLRATAAGLVMNSPSTCGHIRVGCLAHNLWLRLTTLWINLGPDTWYQV